MCVGWPMQVLSSAEAAELIHCGSDFALDAAEAQRTTDDAAAAAHRVLARGRGRLEHVDLRLVGPCAAGDWILVYQGAARERLDPQRAAEIHAALDLVEQGLGGAADLADTDPGFALPSAMSSAQLAALVGSGTAHHPSPDPSPERP